MGIFRLRRSLALLACLCALSGSAWASTVIFRTDAQLVSQSERVVHGRVVAQRTTRAAQGRTIYTVTTLQIIEDLTGVDGTTVDVWELGGGIGGEYMYVGGAVEFHLGEEVLVCLERGPNGLRTVAMGFSKFDVLAAVNGERGLRRNLRDTEVVGGVVARAPYLSEFRALAASATGRPSRPGRAPRVGEQLQSISQPFTFLGPFRWVQADSGTPVRWYTNTSAPTPLLAGDGVAELQTALAAWTAPATASITLQYGGTTFQSDPDGPSFTGLSGAVGVITYEDPNNSINGNVLAVGGGWAGGSGGTVNGTTFSAFTVGYVMFQNAANLSTSFRQSLNYTRVLTHELGHTIGLGHTQQDGSVADAQSNLMYPSCCAGNTPTPPAIGPDDLAGLNYIYPSSAPTCTYSINPPSTSAVSGSSTGSVAVTTQAGCGWTAASNTGFLNISSGTSGTGSGTVGYGVVANAAQATRTGTLTIAGQTFTVNQAAAPCTYTLTPTSASATSAGGAASLTVTAGSGCTWTASSNATFLSITSGSSGSGNGTVGYNVTGNGASFRSGTLTVGGQTFTVNQLGTGPTVTIDRPSLRYGATRSGGTVTAQTSAQVIRLTQTSGAAVSWTATSNQPWLVVSPTSGSGARELSVTVTAGSVASPGSVAGTITLALTGAGNAVSPVGVTLVTMTTGTSANPVGVIDTPLSNSTGVVGAIPVTGWAVDDVDVSNLFLCRSPVAGESAAADGRCGGAAQIYLGEAVFIDDARPDVAGAFPTYPRNYRGGWGFMLLTNMLPNQGNGAYSLQIYAMDREGHIASIGARGFSCDNAHATRPFGAIDTPNQGGSASGASFVNFGWALTPLPKFIPNDGSTITVFVDGLAQGHPTYNNFRSDIATLFPGLNNSNGAIGFRYLDTTSLTDGLHTIAWTVTDNLGSTEGLGSRYFRVSNAAGALTAAVESGGALIASAEALSAAPVARETVLARLGWDPAAPWRAFGANSTGRVVVRSEEISRLELHLSTLGGRYEGHLQVGDTLAPLPVGSQLDADTGVFTWQPGVGFVGSYDLVFVRREGARVMARQDVRVVLQAKGSGFVGPQVVIDTPRWQADVAQPFVLAGWAADLNASEGTGVGTLHAWAYPLTGGAPVFVGAAAYGGARPDVAGVHGEQFRESGYGLVVQGLTPGNYDLAVFAWSTELADFVPAKVVRVTAR